MSGPYFDTGVAIKLVVSEPLSAWVLDFVQKRNVAVPFTRLVELEMENALLALRFRQDITQDQLSGSRNLVVNLVRQGRFKRMDLSLDKVAAESLSLAPIVTAKTGCRTLDLMHVAAAKLLMADEFLSTDRRQIAAARMCGLKVVPVGKISTK